MKEEEISTINTSIVSEPRSLLGGFINTYKNLPELWDTDHTHYTNKYKRNAALDVLLNIMKKWNPSATRLTVRQKINMLRSNYRKYLRKYLGSKYIGPQGEEIFEYKPTNWKFHALRFLEKDNSKNDIIEINIDDNNFKDEASNGSTSGNDQPAPHTSVVLGSITEKEPLRHLYVQKHTPQKNSNKRKKVELEDEYCAGNNDLLDKELDSIGANVICKLKRMNPDQRYHAELLINKVLITGLKNSLSDDTDLTEVYET